MRHLIRPRFLDDFWQDAEFDQLAEFWLRLYEWADEKSRFRARPYHRLEVRLRGFARARAEELEAELCRRVFTPAFPEPLVWRPDPDTLAFTSGFAEFTEQPAAGLALPLLRGEAFDGLLAEFRFTAAGFRRGPHGKSKVEGTVIVVGELRGGRLLVKAIWRTGPVNWEDQPHWSVPWGNEPQLLGALSKFRVTGSVPHDLALKCFTQRWLDRVAQVTVFCVSVPHDRPRLGGLLLRLLLFAAALSLGGQVGYLFVVTGLWFLLFFPLAWTFGAGAVLLQFLGVEFRHFFLGRAAFRRLYARIHSHATYRVPLPPEEAAARLDNPWGRKYTAELLALGCTQAGVFRHDPEEGGRSALVVFLAPDGVTYVLLLVTLGGSPPGQEPPIPLMWPAAISLLAGTLFPDGARFASVNSRHIGFRKKRLGPEAQTRVFADVFDPAEFLARHTEAVRRFADATGRTPAPHLDIEAFRRRFDEAEEATRQAYRDRPYSWSDHLRRYLNLIRREYRE